MKSASLGRSNLYLLPQGNKIGLYPSHRSLLPIRSWLKDLKSLISLISLGIRSPLVKIANSYLPSICSTRFMRWCYRFNNLRWQFRPVEIPCSLRSNQTVAIFWETNQTMVISNDFDFHHGRWIINEMVIIMVISIFSQLS